ncbi:MAG: sulfotransferase domain-containing protein [Reichenbachiella sp.]|uniref:sulfotransferase domain-containing protein n=1 Tax=Reichenbachiella sp. TaxID=2184521 RepID=UPI00329887B8
MNNLPNFLIVGAAKSGTTTLYDCLRQHPEIYLPEKKECKYFSGIIENTGPGDEYRNKKRTRTWEEYIKYFNEVKNEAAIGEATPDYLYYYKPTITSIHDKLGRQTKIIIILRHPIERAYSAYLHNRRDMIEDLDFTNALKAEEDRIEKNYALMWRYKDAGLYYNQVRAFKEAFDEVLILTQEELKEHFQETMEKIFLFLNVDAHFHPQVKKLNATGEPSALKKYLSKSPMLKEVKKFMPSFIKKMIKSNLDKRSLEKKPMSDSDRQHLANYFENDIFQLSEYLGSDIISWKSK